MDLVSIIVPTYKRKPELVKRAIQSLLDQTYENIQIVLVDDNAKPEHQEYRMMIEAMVKDMNSKKIKYLQNERNLGGALSRNHGIKESNGTYITFLDDDDMYEKDKINHQYQYMQEKQLDVCVSDLSIYNEKNQLIDYRNHHDIESFDPDYLFRYHLTKQITGTPTFMFKKDVLDKIGGFDDAIMGQEFYLMAKTIQSKAKIGYFAESNIRAYRYDIEAISTGPNKMIGERKLYQYKKQFFKQLKRKERNYIRCRHFAVMAVANKRNKNYVKAVWYLLVACLTNPFLSVKEALNLQKRKKENKK